MPKSISSKRRQEIAAYAAANARRYQTEKGQRLNVWAIVEQFDILPDVFKSRQKKGWVTQGGKTLSSELIPMPQPCFGRTELTYLESEVAAFLSSSTDLYPAASDPKAAGWLNRQTYRDTGGKLHAIAAEATRLTGVPESTVERFPGKRVKHPERRQAVKIYALDRLKAHANQRRPDRRPAGDAVHVDAQGERWLTETQAQTIHQTPREFCRLWHKRGSILRSGAPAVRRKLIPNPRRGREGKYKIAVFLERDVLAVLAGEEHKHPGVGKGANASRLRAEVADKARTLLRAALAGGRAPAGEVLQEARKNSISIVTLKRIAKELGITSKWEPRTDGRQGKTYWWCPPPGMKKVAGNEANEPAAHSFSEPKRRGRKPSSSTAQIYEYCYLRYVKGDKLAVIRAAAARLFPNAAPPKEDRDVTLYAKRHAQRNGLPLNR